MDLIVLVSQYRFPEGDAGSVRFYHFAVTLQRMGYDVLVVGMGETTIGEQCFQGVPYLSLRTEDRYGSYLFYTWRLRRLFSRLKREERNIKAVVCGFTMIHVLTFLKRYCRSRQIPLIKDVVEWYSPQQFSRGKWSLSYRMKDLENRRVISPPVRVIAISRYLERYFLSKGCETSRIPIYFDVARMPMRMADEDVALHLIYAGSPGKKDYLHLMLAGLSLLDTSALSQIRFVVIGVSESQVKTMISPAEYVRLEPYLDIKGKLPHSEVLSALCRADFSVLLRDSEARYAQAGFPTKVIESLSAGVPMICNYSSDLKDFLIDGENALIVQSLSAYSFATVLKQAIALSTIEKDKMSVAARQCAESRFNIESYRAEWESILL